MGVRGCRPRTDRGEDRRGRRHVRCAVVPNDRNETRSRPASADAGTAQRRAVAELLRVSPVADDLASRFAEAGFSLALVGGSVRDALLGRLGNDLDFTTDARPQDILRIVRPWADAVWEVGIAFGTVGCRKRGPDPAGDPAERDYQLEITTYRSEIYDRTSRKPDVAYGDTLEGDLERRDFTVNAMAVALPRKEFVDPYGGLEDLPGVPPSAPPGGAILVQLGKNRKDGPEQHQPALADSDDPDWAERMVRGAAAAMAAGSFNAVVNPGCATCAVRTSCPVNEQGRQVTQ